MNTTVISFNGQDYEVPLSSKGTAKGQDLISAVGVGPGQAVYRANEDGHEIIQPSDDISIRPGEQFNATPRFITAFHEDAQPCGSLDTTSMSPPINWKLVPAMTGAYTLVSLAAAATELLLHPSSQIRLGGWICVGLLMAIGALNQWTTVFGRLGESRFACAVFGLALELSLLPNLAQFTRTHGIRGAILDCAVFTLGGFLLSYFFFRDMAREAAKKETNV